MLSTTKLVVFTLFGALLVATSNPSQASNVYGATQSHADETTVSEFQPRYWACPAEYGVCPVDVPIITAKASDPFSTTDAPVSDTPDQAGWSLENEMRYYDYSRLIMGD
jgi:hypothetical protein